MKYIQKLETPQFFIDDTKDFKMWKDYNKTVQSRAKKRKLNKYILKKEQNNLCIYCESKIISSTNSSHIEHIKAKYLDINNLTFDYSNLAVSCEGKCHNEEGDNKKYNCGHRKDNEDSKYDENLFLNPTLVEDISDYFVYETYLENSISKVRIKESSKDFSKAEYMLNILNLNDESTTITKARYLALVKLEKAILYEKLTNEQIKIWLKEENPPFISYLQSKYSIV